MSVVPSQCGPHKRSRGIALLIVLVIVMLMITAVYLFQRRAVINVSIARNRLAASEADAIARGGLRIGEAVAFLVRLHDEAGGAAGGDGEQPLDTPPTLPLPGGGLGDLWQQLGDVPIELEGGRSLRIEIEDVAARLNLNALVAQQGGEGDEEASSTTDDEAIEYLVEVLRYIIEGIDAPAEEKIYDERAIARNLIDYMDADDTALDGRNEDEYYLGQDPPYRAANGPLLSFEEIGLVEGVDPPLLEAMRPYLTVHPIGGVEGINLNAAPPWVLSLVYAGTSGDRELVAERSVRDIWELRDEDKIVCTETGSDPIRCVSLNEVGLGEGS
ncbi:MAG: type II secretion system minor pseudopilin GspK, partial [Deltaproteobacteria bacterium]|nr:type II secretion system minor pseudopilin GspK [Deltaproteobacteria bacterium]